MKRTLLATLVAAVAAIVLTPAAASADNFTFSNTAQINIPSSGKASS